MSGLSSRVPGASDGAVAHTGRAADQDILIASARAYVNAINRHLAGGAGAAAAATQRRTQSP